MSGLRENSLQALAAQAMDEVVETASRLIQIRSYSLQEREIAAYIQAKMRALGYDEVLCDSCGSVFGVLKGQGGGASVTLNCHMDVVAEGDAALWPYPPYSGTVAEGRLWGRGASDTKGTLALQLYAPVLLRRAGRMPQGDVVVAAVVAEENAGYGAMRQTQERFLLTDYAILGEATENDIAIANRGRCCLYITITGRACHASQPQLGANPFDMLPGLLSELSRVELAQESDGSASTLSVTRIESSEPGTNTIPAQLTLYCDYRQAAGDDETQVRRKLETALSRCARPGLTAKLDILRFPLTTYTGEQGWGYQGEYPFRVSAEEPYIRRARAAVEAAVGHGVQTKAWGFATDAGHYAAAGVKVLGYSPAEIALCHSTRDSISLAMMQEGLAGTMALIEELAAAARP